MTEEPITTRFPPPWRIIDTGSAFRVDGAEGGALAFVYYRRDDALLDLYLRREDAMEIAKAIARLSKVKRAVRTTEGV